MGGCSSCMRKPVLVYQSILDECYNILFQVNTQNTKLVQKKRYNKSYMEPGQNQENEDFISHFEELTSESIKAQATASYKEFMSYDIPKLEGQVKLQAKNLSDHIQDTHIRLIDTVKYLKAQLKNFQTDYGVQWVTLMILEVLVQNLKNYTQKHISLKHGQVEDSNLVSKLDVLTENNEANNSTKEERQQNANGIQNQNNVQDQITFFSDNFIRFEIDFIDIALFILNEKYNPFYFQSQNQFMKILLKFSQLHKDPYTSDKIYVLVDQLETDLFNLTKEIIPTSNEDQLPQWEAINKQKVQTLSNLQITYQATLSKLKTLQSVFGTKQQLNFFFFSLQTIIDFNRILRNYSQKIRPDNNNNNNNNAVPQSPLNGANDNLLQAMKSSEKSVHLTIAEITSNCLGILAVFSRRGFMLKNYNSVLSNLFQFFDQVKWDTLLLIENIINETISVSRVESVQLNYKVFLMEQLIEYLSLSKQLSGLPSLYFNNNFKQVNVFGNQAHAQSQNEISLGIGGADNNVPQSQKNSKIQQNSAQKEQNKDKDEIIPQGLLKLENFADPKVKIRAFKIFNMLTSQKDKEIPLLMHSTNKIVRCYLDNLKEYNELFEVKRAIQQSFVHYTLQLAPDSSALLSLLTALSNEICEYMSSSSYSKGMQQGSHTPLQSPNTNGINNQMYMIKSPSEHSNSINLINQYYGNDQTKYIIEGLNLMLLALDCSSYFTSSPMITDEVIINLIFICNQKYVSLMVYEVTCKLILLKMKPITESASNYNLQSLNHQITLPQQNMRSQTDNVGYSISNGNSQNNQLNSISQMFQQISQNSLLHIFHQTIKCVFNLNMQQDINSINTAVVIFQYTFLIIQEITKRNNVFQIRAVVAYLMKLIKETINYQSQRDCISVNGVGNSNLDANLFNSTNNQFVLQSIQKNGVGNGQQPVQKHPACFNITQLAIGQILKVIELQIINNTTNSFAEIEHIITNIASKEYNHINKIYQEIFTMHIEISNLNKKLNYQVENYSKALSQQKSFSLKSNSPSGQYQSQDDIIQTLQEHKLKLQKLCQQLSETPYIHNEIFNNTQIQDNIQKTMKSLGLNPEQDFDQLTAQFARNFTSAVGDIDFNNYNFEDEISLNNTAQKNQRKSLNYNYLRLNTNESLGDLERQDDQFGNIMNMIQPQNPNILNYLNDRNRDNKEKFNGNNDYQLKDLNQLQSKSNQQSQFLDAVDIQLKV
ncbi:hypothetical protein TTHERM_00723080 (macronuclear) [Tetrahymena thermophila SB210]|uniref:Uncharacterized protein n=1 Tax=Tetrahymena thermophila (strain SB210) TaxID=312017 RepID=I7MFQ3_TETTS|nr:hypothetical protein TTHERM_00723080 [Tetrahymena thermophila SB210]EAR84123.2 hypothetical protein TTHERM_00723080 [Tetrahymena thermophila SB210]|eukprot:XP_001031786.2 hypothetical protein TTHERM_00723080 [Tetrahymena thermophila SB210]